MLKHFNIQRMIGCTFTLKRVITYSQVIFCFLFEKTSSSPPIFLAILFIHVGKDSTLT